MILRLATNIVILLAFVGFSPCVYYAYADSLAAASAFGETLTVRELLERGVRPDETDEEGYTPLLRVAFAGNSRPLSAHVGIMNLLIEAGANVNATVYVLPLHDENPIRTMSALHRTVAGGTEFLELTRLLLAGGANPNLPSAWGRPLHIAAASARASAGEIELLLEWGADARALNQWGVDPLVEAVIALNPSLEKIALLLEAGANVHALFDWNGHRGLSVLMAAAMNGTSDIVELLLYNGASRHLESEDGLNARDYAINAGRTDNAFLLW